VAAVTAGGDSAAADAGACGAASRKAPLRAKYRQMDSSPIVDDGALAAYPFPLPGGMADWCTRTLTSRFQVVRKVGQGANGFVCEARDHSVQPPRAVVIKRIAHCTGFGANIENTRRVLREVRILRRLSSNSVVKLLHVCPPARPDYTDLHLVFEKMEMDLKALFANPDGVLSLHHVRWFSYKLLLGVAQLHAVGIIHRDIKPANVMIDATTCELKVIDLGLARTKAAEAAPAPAVAAAHRGGGGGGGGGGGMDDEDGVPRHTFGVMNPQPTGSEGEWAAAKPEYTKYVVTRWYRAPELPLFNDGHYDGAALDVWSAGCVIAELFAALPAPPGAARPKGAAAVLFPSTADTGVSPGAARRAGAAGNDKDLLKLVA
jgi:serine/threonine protein kinase